jgi:hypothetical protein
MPKVSGIEILDSLDNPTGVFVTYSKYKKNIRDLYNTDSVFTPSKNSSSRKNIKIKSNIKHIHVNSNIDFIENIKKSKKK